MNYPAPSLEVISDTDNQGQNTSYVLEVLTHDATYLIVNGQTITENDNGRFRTLVDLTTTQTTLDIQAANNVKTTKASVLIEREHTAEELAKQEEGLIRAEARRLELEEIQKKWEATEAGQICLRRSDWSKDDCQKSRTVNIG